MADFAYREQADVDADSNLSRESGSRPQTVTTSLTVGFYGRFTKPALDRLGGFLLTVATAPIVLIVAMVLLMSIGRPALFHQPRVGKNGRTFRMFKFRTMLPDQRNGGAAYDGPDRRRTHKSNSDPRHTSIGQFLRKWSLDEIPQFWNVMLGQMSLVGPRPELVEIVQTKYEPWQHQRHLVRPGVTGLWQVSARSDETLMYEHTEIDLAYVENITLVSDAKILLWTVPAALGIRKGS